MTIAAGGGLILASDSRTTKGYSLEGPKSRDNSLKFIQWDKNWAILTYGLTEIGLRGITTFREEASQKIRQGSATARQCVTEVPALFQKLSEEWSQENGDFPRRDRDVGFVVAGYDTHEKAPKVLNLQSPAFEPNTVTSNYFIAGQWYIARYLMGYLYSDDISLKHAMRMAVYMLDETASVEPTVGGPVNLATVTKRAGVQWIPNDTIETMKTRNSGFRRQLAARLFVAASSVTIDEPKN